MVNAVERKLTHSSRTKNRHEDSSSLPVEMRSSRRPGVPQTISTCHKQRPSCYILHKYTVFSPYHNCISTLPCEI